MFLARIIYIYFNTIHTINLPLSEWHRHRMMKICLFGIFTYGFVYTVVTLRGTRVVDKYGSPQEEAEYRNVQFDAHSHTVWSQNSRRLFQNSANTEMHDAEDHNVHNIDSLYNNEIM